jgi:hypothetical protein
MLLALNSQPVVCILDSGILLSDLLSSGPNARAEPPRSGAVPPVEVSAPAEPGVGRGRKGGAQDYFPDMAGHTRLQRLYLDTSVFGGCFEPEFQEWSNGLLADVSLGLFVGVTSDIVRAEMAGAPPPVQRKFTEFLDCGPECLQASSEALVLVDAYLGHGILTERYRNDMLHIALATVASVDILSSWNFRHIVRFDKITKFNAVNLEYGYRQMAIYSPREVTTHGKD